MIQKKIVMFRKKIVMFQVIFSDVSLFSDVSRHRLDVLKLDGEK
jgi:hypothetical protein